MKNFKSFKEETTLSAEAGERLSKKNKSNTIVINGKRILKNLLIFGPNGSGKSNLLDGLKQMQNMIMHDAAKVTDPLAVNEFLLSPETRVEDTYFDITFSVNKRIYEYEFAYNAKQFTYESLSAVLKTRKNIYFERTETSFRGNDTNLNEVATRTKKNSLVLYTAMQNNIPVPTEVFTWFADELVFVGDYQNTPVVSDLVSLAKDEKVKEQLLKFLHFADFNIVDLEVNEQRTPIDWNLRYLDSKVLSPTMNQLLAVHKVYDENGDLAGKQRLSMESESRGTQKILMIALSFINAELNGNGKTLLFDEFDDSLHLELSKAMISIFNSEANNNQFILTTHELQLLDAGLRIDQIYLVEKDFKGVSELSSIFDFKDTRNTTRGGISYMKRYVEGRFGATPIVEPTEMLNALTATSKESGAL